MICSQGRLADGKGLFEQIAGLGEPILISHIHTKVVEAGGIIMALFAKFSFHQSEDFFVHCDGFVAFRQAPSHAGVGFEVVGCFVQGGGAFIVGVGVLPAHLGFGDFAASEWGAGSILHGDFFAGFDFCEDIIGDGIVACF